jgi:hypothetical protein
MRRVTRLALVLCTTVTSAALAQAGPAGVRDTIPADLRPLLAPHRSEIRLVTLRYSQDRNLLVGNYPGAGGGRGGRGGGAAPDTTMGAPIVVSANRIARLKKFDSNWQRALGALDASRLTPPARAELDSLKGVVATNIGRADPDAKDLSRVLYVFPFAPKLVGLLEERLRLQDVNAERAAGLLTDITKQMADVRATFRAGLTDSSNGTPRANRVDALRSAAAVEALRTNLASWNTFYNSYDPLFDWWVALPYKHADSALAGYAGFLRDTVAHADLPSHRFPELLPVDRIRQALADGPGQVDAYRGTFDPNFFLSMGIGYVRQGSADYSAEDRARHQADSARSAQLHDVPDLAEIVALPQDEMTDIVARFLGRGANGGRGGGGRGNGTPAGPQPIRDSVFYQNWLTSLQSLDFDNLSRNAQVDYLYLKHVAELQLSRVGHPAPTNAPRLTDNSGITGGASGRDSLIRDLQDQLIPYTPEQLMVLAEKEFTWTTAEMIKASRQMGYGDNWKAAVEKTKTEHAPPGGQPAMIRDLIYQAVDYLRTNDLITIPGIDAESQRMSMMTAQAQLSNPFFLGGSEIQVSYPTDGMEYDAREQAMRGNNYGFAHATAFHEMIPGHNLQGYNNSRYAGYRADFRAGTPFLVEGWALYWELILYDKGFDKTPEEKVGAMFWRMHRCARIIFSLKFHMGQWSPQQAIDFLVDRVGHERDNATAEVRRSFQGGYGPLYQAAYLLGGLELKGLRHELVDSKQMTEKAFHDEILRQGSMPIGYIRLAMTKQKLTRDMDINWKFYGDLPDK